MVGLKWKTWIASVLVAATCFVTAPSVHADGRGTAHVANQIKDVTFKEATGITQIRVKGTQAGAFSVYRLERPTRVVVDVAQAQLSEAVRGAHESSVTYTPGTWGVSQIAAQTLDDGGSAVRVIVTLARPGQYDVKADGDDIVVTVTPRDAAPAVIGTTEIAHARADAEAARNESKAAQQARVTAEATAQRATAEASDLRATAADAKAAANEANAAASAAKAQAESAQAEAQRLRDEAKKQSKRAEQAEADAKAARATASSSQATTKESAAAKAKMETLIAAARAEAEAAKSAAASAEAEADRTRAVAKSAEENARREAKALKDAAAADRKAAEENRDAAEQARASAQQARKAADKTLKDAAEREASAKKAEVKAQREREQAQEAAAQATAARDAAAANDSADHQKLDVAARAAERRLKEAEAATQSAEAKRQRAEQDATDARTAIETARSQLASVQEQRVAAEQAAEQARNERKREEKATAQAEHARELAEAASRELHERMAAEQHAADELAAKSKAAAAAREELASADQKNADKRDKRELERNQKEAKRLEAAARDAQRDLSARKKAVEEKQSEVAQLVATREKAAADLTRLQTEAADAKAAASSAIAEANDAKAQAKTAKAEASNAKAQASSAMAEAKTATAQLNDAKAQASSAIAEAKSATAQLNDAKAQAKNAAAEAERAKSAARDAAMQLSEAKSQAKSATAEADRAKADAAVAAAQANQAKAKADDARAERIAEEKRLALLSAQQAAQQAALGAAQASQTAIAAANKPAIVTPTPVVAAAASVSAKAVAPLIAIRDVSFTGDADQGDVAIALSGDAAAKLVSTTATRAEIIIEGADLPSKLERKLDVSHFGSQVAAVSSFRDRENAGRVHLIVDLNAAMTPSIERAGNTLHLKFAGQAGQSVASRHAAQTQNVPSPVMGAFRATTTPPPAQSTTAMQAPSARKTYHGATVDLDFKDAPIHDLLRLLSDVGRVNIVIPDDVKASVTVRMKRVPWDQALEVILASKGLWYRRDGNLYRVADRKQLDAEDEAEAAHRASLVEAEAPTAEILTLNYSDAADLAKKLDPMLSPKGKISVDARTNALIVNDILGNRRAISKLALQLDTQTPQISIEARVVEAQSTFKREIGIQWGGHASASQLTGNSTGLVFPNAVGLTGGATDAATPGAGVATPSDFAVNLPAAVGTGEGGALGVTLGSIGGNFNINLRLSALEDSGTVRIISAPKITVLNNVEAKISQGTAIPISVVAATGTQTQFVNADLSLTVKPYVSQRDCSIAMDVTVTKDEPDFVNKGARGDPTILRKQVHTKMLVADGETTVMGGIYTRNTGLSYTKVPLLGDLPVIGWLFKHRTENDTRTEVLVFLTPKITNKAFLRCQ